jgi:hypothetical protein
MGETDITERARFFLKFNQVDTDIAHNLIRDLLAELKAARAENERLGQAAWIKTVAELQKLKPTPELLGGVLIKSVGVPSFGGVFELNDDGTWNEFDSDLDRVEPEDIPLPVIVLWIPR